MDKGKVAGTSGLPSVENLSGTNTPRRGILGGEGGVPAFTQVSLLAHQEPAPAYTPSSKARAPYFPTCSTTS